MTPVNKNKNPNCIKTSSVCITWDAGDIEYLGICNGNDLPEVIWEIVAKLKEIAGQDLSAFDIDTLLTICNQRAPLEKNLITILEILKTNDICLKNYIDTLAEQIAELSKSQNVNVNLKCLADFDNFGNQLGITREQLDQLVIDELCAHDSRITTIEGKVTSLQNQVNNINVNPIVQEPEFSTCLDAAVKPTSGQTVSIANKVCSIENYLGTSTDASNARSNFDFEDSRYQLIPGWLLPPQRENILNDYNNLLLIVKDLEARIIDIQTNCCAPTCDKIKIGFSYISDDNVDFTFRFRSTDGNLLFGFEDTGFSTITFRGISKITNQVVTYGPFPVNIEDETGNDNIYAIGNIFKTGSPIIVSLSVKLVKDTLVCEKCISQEIMIFNTCEGEKDCSLFTISNETESSTVITWIDCNTGETNQLTLAAGNTTSVCHNRAEGEIDGGTATVTDTETACTNQECIGYRNLIGAGSIQVTYTPCDSNTPITQSIPGAGTFCSKTTPLHGGGIVVDNTINCSAPPPIV
jgi:hypothetical protein